MADFEARRATEAARFLCAVRLGSTPHPVGFEDSLRPPDRAAAEAIQRATLDAIGAIGGWKVGANSPDAPPIAAPLPASGIVASGATVAARLRLVEGEICFRMARDLPPLRTPYVASDVLQAIGACMASIEILDTRFADMDAIDPWSALADLQNHGGLVVGQAVSTWSVADFETLEVELDITDRIALRAVASNPAGTDLARLLVALANSDLVRECGGLAAGHVVTTGSWTGKKQVPEGGRATVRFDRFPPVSVGFASAASVLG